MLKIKHIFTVLILTVFLFGINNLPQARADSDVAHGLISKVVLRDAVLSEFHYNNCPGLTVLLQNNTHKAQTVLVDVELYNSTGQVYQKFWDNYVAQPTNSNFDSLFADCSLKLPNGNYSYAVGIFSPGWNGLVHWYNSVQAFTVAVAANP